MAAFPIDRAHPPRRIEARHGDLEVHLRPYDFEDVDAILVAIEASLPSLRRFMPWAHLPRTRESQLRVVQSFAASYWGGQDLAFGIFSPGGDLLGGCGLHARTPLNPNGLEVGYWGNTLHRGKGYVTLTVRALVVLAFDVFGCDRLQVSHDEANVESQRVVERCGFALEGVIRNLIADADPAARAGGYIATRRSRQYALFPDDLDRLPWIDEVRAGVRYVDAFGGTSGRRA